MCNIDQYPFLIQGRNNLPSESAEAGICCLPAGVNHKISLVVGELDLPYTQIIEQADSMEVLSYGCCVLEIKNYSDLSVFFNLKDVLRRENFLKNIIDESEYFGEIEKMRMELNHWMKRTKDPLLYIFENKDDEEKVKDLLYESYPDLKRVDNEIASKFKED